MKGSNVCVATSYDNGFSKIGAFSAASIELYAQKWGFDTYVDGQVKLDRPTPWHRVRLIPELFKLDYEYVLWIDADAVIVDQSRNILEEVETGKDLYIVEHAHPEFESSKVPNTGVMLARNCPWSVSFFDDLWKMDEYEEHPWWENAAAMKMFGYLNLLDEGEFAPRSDVLKHVKFLDDIWNHLPEISPPGGQIIEHFAGMSNDVRVEQMPRCLLRAISSSISDEAGEPESKTGNFRSALASLFRPR